MFDHFSGLSFQFCNIFTQPLRIKGVYLKTKLVKVMAIVYMFIYDYVIILLILILIIICSLFYLCIRYIFIYAIKLIKLFCIYVNVKLIMSVISY